MRLATVATFSGRCRRLASVLVASGLAACASVEPVSLQTADATLGAAQTQAIRITGSCEWYQFGQAPAPGLPWPAFELKSYQADVDYGARAARVQTTRLQRIEPGRARPAPTEQRLDHYVVGAQSWVLPTAGGMAPVPQPALAAERGAEIWSTPQGFVKAAMANAATTRATAEGTEVAFKLDGRQRYVGLLDAKGEVLWVRSSIPTPLLGDTLHETRFSGYRDFGGLRFPARIVRTQGGHPVLDLKVAEVRRIASPGLTVPAEVAGTTTLPMVVVATRIADGVHYLTGGTHHSVLIEQADHLVLVEAPLNEERSLALIGKAKEMLPAKPIRYVINTHAHFDHAGGLPTFVAAGAIVVTHQGNRAYYEKAWSRPARFETFTKKHVLGDGTRSIEMHELAGNGHNDAFAFVYLPAEKILIQADAYTPAAPNLPPPAEANPYSVNLHQHIEALKLDVVQIAPLHGRLVTLADLRKAIGMSGTAPR